MSELTHDERERLIAENAKRQQDAYDACQADSIWAPGCPRGARPRPPAGAKVEAGGVDGKWADFKQVVVPPGPTVSYLAEVERRLAGEGGGTHHGEGE